MKYFILAPNDQRNISWILSDLSEGPLKLRERYFDFQCSSCKKVDEFLAIESGIDEGIIIKSKDDFLLTGDGFLCISQRMQETLLVEDVKGIKFIEIPSDKHYKIIVPTEFAEVDLIKAETLFIKPQCNVCKRYSEVIISPSIVSMTVPSDSMTFFAPTVWRENIRAKVTWLYATEVLVKILKEHKFKGIYYEKMNV